MLEQRVIDDLFNKCGIDLGQKLLIGVSGGPDSLTLLHVLQQAGANLVVAHLDHQLRANSKSEARFVADFVQQLGLPFVTEVVDVHQYAKEHKQSIEEAARECRYAFLFQTAQSAVCQAVVVGHTADDQVETVLMHLLRGAGMSGLKGMAYCEVISAWHNSLPLVRPMLGLWRAEVEAYCESKGLVPVIDDSNRDLTYYRNRLRHQLLPILQTYNPNIKQVFWRMADVLAHDEQILTELTQQTLQECLVDAQKGYISLDRQRFNQKGLGMQRRLLRSMCAHLRPSLRDIGFDTIDRAIKTLQQPGNVGRVDFIDYLDLMIKKDVFYIIEKDANLRFPNFPQLKNADFAAQFQPGSAVDLANGWKVQADLLEDLSISQIPQADLQDPNQAWLNAESFNFPLVVRGRQEGERFQPLGMGGHSQKLSDFFINKNIPQEARDLWPLLTSGEHIVWIAGLQPAHNFRMKGSEKAILHLQLLKSIQ